MGSFGLVPVAVGVALFLLVVGTRGDCSTDSVQEGQVCTSDDQCANNVEVNSANGNVLGAGTLYCLFESANTSTCQKLAGKLFGSPCNTGAQCTPTDACLMQTPTEGTCQNTLQNGDLCTQFTLDNCPPGQLACGTNPCAAGLLCLPPKNTSIWVSTQAVYNCSTVNNCTCQAPPAAGTQCTLDASCQWMTSLPGHQNAYATCKNGTCAVLGDNGMGCTTGADCLPGLTCQGAACALMPLNNATFNATNECNCTSGPACPPGTICLPVTMSNITKQTCVPALNETCAPQCNPAAPCGFGEVYFCVNNVCSMPGTGKVGDKADNKLACGPGLTVNANQECVNITGIPCASQSECWGTGAFAYCDCTNGTYGTCALAVNNATCPSTPAKASADYALDMTFCCAANHLPEKIKGFFSPSAANINCSTKPGPPWGIILGVAAGALVLMLIIAGALVVYRRFQLRRPGYEQLPLIGNNHL